MKIYKYKLEIIDEQPLDNSFIRALFVGLDPAGVPCLWAEVEPDENESIWRNREKIIFIVGTGNTIPTEATEYVGSFVERCFVWHVYIGDKING